MYQHLIAALLLTGSCVAADGPLKGAKRVVFLGDSNTFSGRFIAYLDTALISQTPDRAIELINLGLPSETVSGLSEPDHPYPRPNVHSRLAAVLSKTKPDVVVACYGMNDGIYYPFDETRFAKYQEGYRTLIAACEKAGATVVLMTPSPFDPKPLKDKVLPIGTEKYSWMKPYAQYDDVLTRYSEWLLTFRDKGYAVADPHTAVLKHLSRMRVVDPSYRVSGDGIHPDANGHYVVFRELAEALKIPLDGLAAEIDFKTATSSSPGIERVVAKDGELGFAWKTRLPFPRDADWDRRLTNVEQISSGIGKFRLMVKGLADGKYSLQEAGAEVGIATNLEWAEGVDIGQWSKLSANKRAAAIWKLLEEKNRVLGLAWLTDVGHKRPDTPKGIPLAEAQKKAAELEAKAKELAKPIEMPLKLVPVKP